MRKKKGISYYRRIGVCCSTGSWRLCPGGTDREKEVVQETKGGTDDTSGT